MPLSRTTPTAARCALAAYLGACLAVAGPLAAQTGTPAQTGVTANANTATPALQLSVTLNGAAPANLSGSSFTLTDNGTPSPIQSFEKARNTHVIVVIDDVNAPLTTIAYERSELKHFLTRNDGRLPVPLAFAVMTDTKAEIQPTFSTDGNAENAALQKYEVGLHTIHRNSQYGGFDRTNIGISTLQQVVRYAATIPGHKLILFISPGWPLLSGPRIDLTAKEANRILEEVAHLQDAMLQSNTTLGMINPFGPQEPLLRSDYYTGFLKGVEKPSRVDIADLSLQVLATHSGGSVLQGTSDIAGMFDRSLRELDNTYTVRFQPAPPDEAVRYHSLKLTSAQPSLNLRAPDEYYTLPTDAPRQ